MTRREFALISASALAARAEQGHEIAVKMLNPPAAPVGPVVEELRKAGVAAVFARIDRFLFDPTVGRDVREFRRLMGEAGIQFFITVPTFLDPEGLAKDPGLTAYGSNGNPSKSTEARWLQMVCPARPEYRKQRTVWFADMVRELKPTGLSLDFIRYFIYWEGVAPDRTGDSIEKFCFCDHCLGLMTTELGFRFPPGATTRQAKAAWVLANHREPWTAWKCEKITSMARESAAAAKAVHPGVKISLHGIPWLEHDFDGGLRVVVGQDPGKLAAHVDIFGPMCYFEMLHRPPEWVHDVAENYFRLTGKPPLPSVQATGRGADPESRDALRKHLAAGFAAPSAGVNVYQWNSIRNDAAKLAMLRAAAGKE